MKTLERALHRTRQGDDGFTLLEVVVTMVIMGLVIGPLTIAMMQTMNTLPQSSQRVQLATDSQGAESWISTDLTQGGQVNFGASPNASTGAQGGDTQPFYANPGSTYPTKLNSSVTTPCVTADGAQPELFSVFSWDATKGPTLYANIVPVGAPTWSLVYYKWLFSADGSVMRVELHRFESTLTWSPLSVSTLLDDGAVFRGFCTPADGTIAALTSSVGAATGSFETIKVVVNLRSSPTSAPTQTTLSTTLRLSDG